MFFNRFSIFELSRVNFHYLNSINLIEISSFSLILENNNQICNLSLFNSMHAFRALQTVTSQATSSIQLSKNYIQSIQSTLDEMGVSTTRLQNLDVSMISNMVSAYSSLQDFVQESTDYPLQFYIYPPYNDPNYDLTSYTDLITGETNMAYFKSKYSFLNYNVYLKVAGTIREAGDIQSIVPIFVGIPLIRTDNEAVSLTLQLSNDATVFGIIVQTAYATSPNGTQVAFGVDGDGKTALGTSVQSTLTDSEDNYLPVTLAFYNLTNNVSYIIFYVSSLPAPRDPLVSWNVYNVSVTPQNPLIGQNNKRILMAEENDEFNLGYH